MLCSSVCLTPRPWLPASRALAAATLAIAEVSRFLISSDSDRGEGPGAEARLVVVASDTTLVILATVVTVVPEQVVVTRLVLVTLETLVTVVVLGVCTTGP